MEFVEIRELQAKLKENLKPERYEHTLGVMYTAASMAMAWKYDLEKTMLAALLHDCAKCLSYEDMLSLCEESGMEISETSKTNKALLHSKAGAVLANKTYGIVDEEILHAIDVHTTGMPRMNLLDKIVFVADYIEPGRMHAPNLSEVRKLAFTDIDGCVAQISKDTLEYLGHKGYEIDSLTKDTYEYYKNCI